ncbi:MAG TPA: hypothetical protein VGN59_14110 [Acidimicrobiia bacterium]
MGAISTFEALDVLRARELTDGYAPDDAPFRDLGEPSWFRTDADRRRYWLAHAAEVVAWARHHGFPQPRAAARYGLPGPARAAMWQWD